jgi:spore coat polysaccharide biosynthesis protein SpsF
MPLLGIPSIAFMVQRVRRSNLIDDLLVATSLETSDDPLADELQKRGIQCFRGNLRDVLDRFYQAARVAKADHVVRLTGDCPLMDADLIDTALDLLESSGADYVSNVDPPTFPDGLDVEAFPFTALERAWHDAKLTPEREHVTMYLRNRKDLFRAASWRAVTDLSVLRWTVDYPEDQEYVSALLSALPEASRVSFDRFDLYRAIERSPNLARRDHQPKRSSPATPPVA